MFLSYRKSSSISPREEKKIKCNGKGERISRDSPKHCSPFFALGGVWEHDGKESDMLLFFTPTKIFSCGRHLTSKLEHVPSFGGKEKLACVQMALKLASFWQRQTEMRLWHFEAHHCFAVHRHMKEAEPSFSSFEVGALPLVWALKWPKENIPNGRSLIL